MAFRKLREKLNEKSESGFSLKERIMDRAIILAPFVAAVGFIGYYIINPPDPTSGSFIDKSTGKEWKYRFNNYPQGEANITVRSIPERFSGCFYDYDSDGNADAVRRDLADNSVKSPTSFEKRIFSLANQDCKKDGSSKGSFFDFKTARKYYYKTRREKPHEWFSTDIYSDSEIYFLIDKNGDGEIDNVFGIPKEISEEDPNYKENPLYQRLFTLSKEDLEKRKKSNHPSSD